MRSHTILTAAGVHLESILIAVDVKLDAGEVAGHTSDGTHVMPVIGSFLRTINDIAVIVTCAVSSAISDQLRCSVVCSDLLGGGPKVVDRVFLIWQNDAVWDEDSVDTNTLTGIRQGQGVVQCSGGLGVGEGIQIPVNLFYQRL